MVDTEGLGSSCVPVALRLRDCDFDSEIDSLLVRDFECDSVVLFLSKREFLGAFDPLDSELGFEEFANSLFLDFDNDIDLVLALVFNLEVDFDLVLDGDLLE